MKDRSGGLSTVSSVFDPLGLVSPFIQIGKGILQELCRDGEGWDDKVPEHIRVRWEKWGSEVPLLENIHQEVVDRDNVKGRKKTSYLRKLDPFLDENNVLRVGGRFRLSSVSYECRHPIILPTELIIRHYHQAVEHQGRGITQNVIRFAVFTRCQHPSRYRRLSGIYYSTALRRVQITTKMTGFHATRKRRIGLKLRKI